MEGHILPTHGAIDVLASLSICIGVSHSGIPIDRDASTSMAQLRLDGAIDTLCMFKHIKP